jgi:hypothetical protein
MVVKRRIKRTIDFRYRLTCFYCTTGEIIYQSQFSNVHDEKEKEEEDWTESLVLWGDKMRVGIAEFLERAARQKCKKYGRAQTVCWKYEIQEPGINFGEEERIYHVLEKEEVKVAIPEAEISKGIIDAIKGYENSAKVLRDTASKMPIPTIKADLEKNASELENRANELREKYNLVGKEI